MSVSVHHYRGAVSPADQADVVEAQLALLAELFPVGTRIVHDGGRCGTIVQDQPPHVPGLFTGKPTAWCLPLGDGGQAQVCARWDNPDGLVWLAWAPITKVRPAAIRRSNRPGNRWGQS
ncbi:hypothetical protein ACFWPV_10215 [Streptomyces uncialis]|uniref:hypothetical protein n=1 Tax=Streptomyces uncialis TaxID=1048205 RepID=UPI003657FDD9